MRRVLISAVTFGALVTVTTDISARSSAPRFRLVDRTLLCTTVVDPFGDRPVVAAAQPALSTIDEPDRPASAEVYTGKGDRIELLGVARRSRTGTIWQNIGRCRRIKTVIPLSNTGFPGPPVRFGKEYECNAGVRVLVRVRARFAAPTSWVREDFRSPGDPVERGIQAEGRITEAQLAVRTHLTRRPLAFATINAEGETQLFAASRCD
jgi:hypothetical protein